MRFSILTRARNLKGAELALESASRILPIVTSAYGPSAANNTYWPEMYTLQPMVDPRHNNPYSDTPAPKVFGNASPFDPQLFSGVNEFAEELLKGERSGKYSPVEVAQWLEDLAQTATTQLAQTAAQKTPEFRRIAIDVSIQAALGRFFAARFRSGVLYEIHERSGHHTPLEEALKMSRQARDIWARMAESARGIYASDVTVGELAWLRGHWLDRLPAIDADIADMAKRLEGLPQSVAAAAHQSRHRRRTRPSKARIGEFQPLARNAFALAGAALHRVEGSRVDYRIPLVPAFQSSRGFPENGDAALAGKRPIAREHPRQLCGFAISAAILF